MTDSRISAPNRRTVLRGAMFTAAAVPLGVTLSSCATGGGDGEEDDSDEPAGDVSDDNPFGMAEDVQIDAVIFDGGYGTDYVEFAGDQLTDLHPDAEVTVAPSNDISQELQPRFVGGNPPDLVDNSGENQIGMSTILDQLEDLTEVIEAPNYEGTPIKDTLYDGSLITGTYGDKLAAINYVMSVYGVWYSASLFEENGWTVPTTWEEAIDLGAKAEDKGYYLFGWGKEAATYYQTLALGSAYKQGGDEVRLALENLKEDCWSLPAVQDVFKAMKECIDKGYFKPGGSGTQFTAAQAQWSNEQEWLLYPSGAWIENEMKDQTKDDFQMTCMPAFVIDDSSKMPATGLHAEAGEPYIVPSDGQAAAGKEMLRAMLSKEAAQNFIKEKLAPTIVKDLIPEDGFGHTALVSQADLLDAAGSDVFVVKFTVYYGMNTEQLPIWNSFLSGDKSVEELTSDLQDITDRVREDDSIEKIEVS